MREKKNILSVYGMFPEIETIPSLDDIDGKRIIYLICLPPNEGDHSIRYSLISKFMLFD
jgi:hypothetical protein